MLVVAPLKLWLGIETKPVVYYLSVLCLCNCWEGLVTISCRRRGRWVGGRGTTFMIRKSLYTCPTELCIAYIFVIGEVQFIRSWLAKRDDSMTVFFTEYLESQVLKYPDSESRVFPFMDKFPVPSF